MFVRVFLCKCVLYTNFCSVARVTVSSMDVKEVIHSAIGQAVRDKIDLFLCDPPWNVLPCMKTKSKGSKREDDRVVYICMFGYVHGVPVSYSYMTVISRRLPNS